MELIRTISNPNATSVNFTSIPQIYDFLELHYYIRTNFASIDTLYAYNYNNNTNSTGSIYYSLQGDGSGLYATAGSGSFSSIVGWAAANESAANIYSVGIMRIYDYTSTTKNKTILSRFAYDRNGFGYVGIYGNVPYTLPGTAAVTTLTLLTNGTIQNGSTFSLYGIGRSELTGV